MHSYIIIHHTPDIVEVALFINNTLHDQRIEDKRLASKLLVPLLDSMLTRNAITLSHIDFIGINQGPGMFSTLRSIIATVNALHYATQISLIGIDALDATTLEFYDPSIPYTATLLNACNNEVYYDITHHKKTLLKGYCTIEKLLLTLAQRFPQQTIHCIGNGTALYQDSIKQNNSINAVITHPIPLLCSLGMVGKSAEEKYTQQKYGSYLFPLHLKKHAVERE